REGESMARPLAGLLVVLFVSPLAAAPPARDGTAPRTDRNGDPLPKGAVARLGIPYLYNPGAEIMAFLPDGKTLAVAAGGTLRRWDVGSSRERRHFTTHPQHGVFPTPITCLAVSPDGKLLAVGCEDGIARLWEVDTGKELRQFEEKNASVEKLAFSPDGKRLAAGGHERPVRVWDVAAGQSLATMGDKSSGEHLSFSADGKRLTTLHRVPRDWNTRILTHWDAVTGKELWQKKVDDKTIWSGGLSPDGRLLASPTGGGEVIRLIDTDTGKEVRRTEGEAFGPAFIVFSA